MFVLSKWSENSKQFEIMIQLVLVLRIVGINLILCEFGEEVTYQFGQFDVEFGRCEWIKLSIKMQRIYLNFLLDTQQPKNIQSYGGIECTRETFKKVFDETNVYRCAFPTWHKIIWLLEFPFLDKN